MKEACKHFMLRKENCLIIVLVGVLLAVVLLPGGNRKTRVGTNTGNGALSDEQSRLRTQSVFGQGDTGDAAENTFTETEERLTYLLSGMEGVGSVRLMIQGGSTAVGKGNAESVYGIVVLAEGATNDDMKRKITEIVQALFPVEAHRIRVGKLKKEK